jgi:hypothetical protein
MSRPFRHSDITCADGQDRPDASARHTPPLRLQDGALPVWSVPRCARRLPPPLPRPDRRLRPPADPHRGSRAALARLVTHQRDEIRRLAAAGYDAQPSPAPSKPAASPRPPAAAIGTPRPSRSHGWPDEHARRPTRPPRPMSSPRDELDELDDDEFDRPHRACPSRRPRRRRRAPRTTAPMSSPRARRLGRPWRRPARRGASP